MQQAGHDKRIALRNDTAVVGRIGLGWRVDQNPAPEIADAGDEVGRDKEPAIGQHGVSRGHLHHRHRSGTERQCQVGWVLVQVKTKAAGPLLGIARTDGLQHADGDHVFRPRQAGAQAHGAVKFAVVIFGFPGLPARHATAEKQG